MLARPWVLGEGEQARCLADAEAERVRAGRREAKGLEREKWEAGREGREREKIERRWRREEEARRNEAEKARVEGRKVMDFLEGRKRRVEGFGSATVGGSANVELETRTSVPG